MELFKNPIIHDTKITKSNETILRYIKLPYNVNYGMIPQTWEDNTKELLPYYKGDDDSLDCLEITNSNFTIGEIVEVEVLGSFCLLDQNEVDWKIFTGSKKYLESKNIKGNALLESYVESGKMKELLDKLKNYKTFEGKQKK